MKITKEIITSNFSEFELQAIIHTLFMNYGNFDIIDTVDLLNNLNNNDLNDNIDLLNDIGNFECKPKDVFDFDYICFDYESHEITGSNNMIDLLNTGTWTSNISLFYMLDVTNSAFLETLKEKAGLFIDKYIIQ